MLSLSPRYDLFRFAFPKDFLPKEIEKKYVEILNKNQAVIISPIEYLNESIKSINIPGLSEALVTQSQHGSNNIFRDNQKLGKINIEPKHDINYNSSNNPLDMIDKEFKVTFRMNQGLYNYFMLYETLFYRICKPTKYPPDKIFKIELLDEDGVIISTINYFDVYIDGIEGLDFSYDKIERDAGTFDVTFKFNNIDFEFL